MKEAKLSEFKNGLGRYLALVRKGETVRLLDRNVPVAHVVPIAKTAPDSDRGDSDALAAMERKGLIRRGTGRIDPRLIASDPPGKPCGVLQALLAEREAR